MTAPRHSIPHLRVERSALSVGRSSPAFTLIETALALLAISLGLLGIFGLARHGLKAAGDTEQETRSAILAESFFGALRAKNAEMTAKHYSLNDWWLYWLQFASGSSGVTLYLPYDPVLAPNDNAIRFALGTHELDEYLTPATLVTSMPWNPTYTLTLQPNGFDWSALSAATISAAYERGEIDVELSIHPGELVSGAATRTYSMTLIYAGGLP